MPKSADNRNEPEVRDAAAKRQAPSAAVVFEAIRKEGEEELRRGSAQLAWSALAAGLAMGFSFLTEALIADGLPDAGWADVVSAFGYTTGFVIVVLGRQQMFTETPLIAVLPVLDARRLSRLGQMLRLWSVVLAANVVGTFLFALVVAKTGIVDGGVHEAGRELTAALFSHDISTMFVSAVFAGWLIALMVWLLPFAESARVGVIILTTYIIGLAGFPHVVAGSVKAFYGLVEGMVSWQTFLAGFFLPTLLGNIVGGVVLVAALNYGQVSHEERE